MNSEGCGKGGGIVGQWRRGDGARMVRGLTRQPPTHRVTAGQTVTASALIPPLPSTEPLLNQSPQAHAPSPFPFSPSPNEAPQYRPPHPGTLPPWQVLCLPPRSPPPRPRHVSLTEAGTRQVSWRASPDSPSVAPRAAPAERSPPHPPAAGRPRQHPPSPWSPSPRQGGSGRRLLSPASPGPGPCPPPPAACRVAQPSSPPPPSPTQSGRKAASAARVAQHPPPRGGDTEGGAAGGTPPHPE